jgi:hypothetical protein
MNMERIFEARREIVAANIDGIITNDRKVIIEAVHYNRKIEFLDRGRMMFMAACDLGPQWTNLAESPTLFILNEKLNDIDWEKSKELLEVYQKLAKE